MKVTGIVRRIDELGRIVIPKEIRKNLRIQDGESMEIVIVDDGNILLKRYMVMNKLEGLSQNFTDAIYGLVKKNVLITDIDKVIACSGKFKKEYLDKKISDEEDSANVMVDMVADKRSIDPAEQAMANFQKLDLLEKIKANMNLLTQKEQRLVALKYGFETGKPMSMTEIQEILGCSRENVKKLEARIYRKWKQAGVEEE